MPAPEKTVGERTKELLAAGVAPERIRQMFREKTGRELSEIPENWPLSKAQAGDLPAESLDLPDASVKTTAPAGAKDTPYVNAMAPTAKIGGMLRGAGEAVGDIASEGMALVGDYLTEAMANVNPFYSGPVTRTRTGPLAKAAKERKAELEKKAAQPFIKALTHDVGETLSAIPAMAASLGEGVVYPASIPADADATKYLGKQGEDIGHAVATGAVVTPAMMLAHPMLSAEAEPFQAALTFVPELRAAGGLVKSTKLGQRLTKAAQEAKHAALRPVKEGVTQLLERPKERLLEARHAAAEAAGASTIAAETALADQTAEAGETAAKAATREEETRKQASTAFKRAKIIEKVRALPDEARRLLIDSTASSDPVLRALLVETTQMPEQHAAGIRKLGQRLADLPEPEDVAPLQSARPVDRGAVSAARKDLDKRFAKVDEETKAAIAARKAADEAKAAADALDEEAKQLKAQAAQVLAAPDAPGYMDESERVIDSMVETRRKAKVARQAAEAAEADALAAERAAATERDARLSRLAEQDEDLQAAQRKVSREREAADAASRGRAIQHVFVEGSETARTPVPDTPALPPLDDTALKAAKKALDDATRAREAKGPLPREQHNAEAKKLRDLKAAVTKEEEALAAAKAARGPLDLSAGARPSSVVTHPYAELADTILGEARDTEHNLAGVHRDKEAIIAELHHVIHGDMGTAELLRVPEIRKQVVQAMRRRLSDDLGQADMRWGGAGRGMASGLNLPLQFEKYLENLTSFDPAKKVNVPHNPILEKALADAIQGVPNLRQRVVRATLDGLADRAARERMSGALRREGEKLDDLIARSRQAEAEQRQRGTVLMRDPNPQLTKDWGDLDIHAINGDLQEMLQSLKDERVGVKENAYTVRANERGANIKKVIAKLQTFKQLDPDLTGSSAWVDPVVHDAITTAAKAKKAMQDVTATSWVVNQMKRNLTSRNLKSAMNNVGSNLLMQAIRTGDPLGGLVEATKAWKAYRQLGKWERGEIAPVLHKGTFAAPDPAWTPQQKLGVKWDALAKTGLFDSTALDRDLAALGQAQQGLPGLRQMEAFYKAGDNFFKAGEASAEYDRLMSAIEKLKDGEFIEIPDQAGQPQRLTKMATIQGEPSFLVEHVGDKGRTRAAGRYTLPDLLADAAAKAANDLFFDYGQVPKFSQIMRYQPAMGLLSPFYSWTVKALDLPGFKKGLGYHVIAGRPTYNTNSAAVLRAQAREQMALGARRAVLLGGLKADLQSKSSQELLEGTQYFPNEVKLGLARVASDPSYVETARMGNWNFLNADLDFFKLLAAGVDKFTPGRTFDEPTHGGATRLPKASLEKQIAVDKESLLDPNVKADPEAVRIITGRIKDAEQKLAVPETATSDRVRARMHGTGQTGGLQEVFSLIGAAGSPLADLLAVGKRDQVYGEDVSVDDVVKAFGKAVIGGTAADLVDTGLLMANGPGTRWSSYRYSATPETRESVTRFVIRKLTGMGWMRISPEDTDKFFDRARKEWKASLGVPKLKREMESYEEQELPDKAAAAEAEMDRLEDIVDDEIDAMQDEYDALKAKLGARQDRARGAESY